MRRAPHPTLAGRPTAVLAACPAPRGVACPSLSSPGADARGAAPTRWPTIEQAMDGARVIAIGVYPPRAFFWNKPYCPRRTRARSGALHPRLRCPLGRPGSTCALGVAFRGRRAPVPHRLREVRGGAGSRETAGLANHLYALYAPRGGPDHGGISDPASRGARVKGGRCARGCRPRAGGEETSTVGSPARSRAASRPRTQPPAFSSPDGRSGGSTRSTTRRTTRVMRAVATPSAPPTAMWRPCASRPGGAPTTSTACRPRAGDPGSAPALPGRAARSHFIIRQRAARSIRAEIRL